VSCKTESVMFVLYCEYLWLYIKYSKPYSILCNCVVKSLSGLFEQRKSLGVVLEHRSLILVWLCKGSLLELSLSKEVSFLCDWATCNSTLHFSGTLLGSARGTGLLPVCGRNLYNCLCSFFLCSLHLSAAQRLWTHSDSELLQTLNLRTILIEREEKFLRTQFNPPFLCFFSPSNHWLCCCSISTNGGS